MFFRCLVLSDHPFFCQLTNGFIVSALMMIIDQQWDKKKKKKTPSCEAPVVSVVVSFSL